MTALPQPGEFGGMTSIGLEVVQISSLRQLRARLAHELERQATAWDEIDKSLANEFGERWIKAHLETPVRWLSGNRLGVLGLPWSDFPALTVMVDQASPSAESSQFDQSTHAYAPQLYAECVIRSDAFEGGSPDPTPDQRILRVEQEGLLDRRAKRTIEAIVQCFGADPTLGRTIPELPAPTVGQTDPFNIDGEEPGKQYQQRIFSLIRVQYTLDTYASRPNAGQPGAAVLPMDWPA